MARCKSGKFISEDGTPNGMCISMNCENLAICLSHRDYEIHRKIAEAGVPDVPKRRDRKQKLNECFMHSPNDNKCRGFHPEANCPYPLCDNEECEYKRECCLYKHYEVER